MDDPVVSPPSPVEFVEAWKAHEREGARLALAAHRLELAGEWALDGSVSMAAWLREHCRLSSGDATALVHRGRFLAKFDAIAEAAVDGSLSAGQISALKNACSHVAEPVLQDQQAELVGIVAPLTVGDTQRAAGVWRQRAESIVDLPEPVEPDRKLTMAYTSGVLLGKFVIDTEGALQFEQAIRIASTWDGTSDSRSNQRRSADALVDVCAFFNANHDRRGTPRQRPHVELFVEADSLQSSPLAWTSDHAWLGTTATDTLLCDCVIHRVLRAGDAVLAYGRAIRTVPSDLFRAVAARDGGCRFPGCDRKIAWTDAHHIRYWRNMGLTELENLVLLCNRHHHFVHRNDVHLKLLPSAELEVTLPDSTVRVSQPRGRPAAVG